MGDSRLLKIPGVGLDDVIATDRNLAVKVKIEGASSNEFNLLAAVARFSPK